MAGAQDIGQGSTPKAFGVRGTTPGHRPKDQAANCDDMRIAIDSSFEFDDHIVRLEEALLSYVLTAYVP